MELGGLLGIGNDVVLEENKLTLKQLHGWQLEVYADEFKLYLKTAANRGISKEEIKKLAQWGLKTNAHYPHPFAKDRILILKLLSPEEYIDLRLND